MLNCPPVPLFPVWSWSWAILSTAPRRPHAMAQIPIDIHYTKVQGVARPVTINRGHLPLFRERLLWHWRAHGVEGNKHTSREESGYFFFDSWLREPSMISPQKMH